MQSSKFSLVKQTWKGQKVIREGPSRTSYRLFFNLESNGGLMHFAFELNPALYKKTIGTFVPSKDKDALTRGKPGEEKDYLEPKEGSFWNDSKNTPSEAIQLDSGNATFMINDDSFKRILFNGKKLRGVYALTQQDKSDMWNIEKNIGPGGKITEEKSSYPYPYPKK